MLNQRLKERNKKKLKATKVEVVNKKKDRRGRGEEKETQEEYIFHYAASLQCSTRLNSWPQLQKCIRTDKTRYVFVVPRHAFTH